VDILAVVLVREVWVVGRGLTGVWCEGWRQKCLGCDDGLRRKPRVAVVRAWALSIGYLGLKERARLLLHRCILISAVLFSQSHFISRVYSRLVISFHYY